jgi:hypothetical protein
MKLVTLNVFYGILGHFLTHYLAFNVLFGLAISHGFPQPIYMLLWMSGIILAYLI